MDSQNILLDIFKYFTKFVGRNGILRNFSTGQGAEYVALKEFCQALPENGTIPIIDDYVFGVNEESVEKRIKNIKGIYLFVDYGNFQTSENELHVKTDELHLAVTVAKPLNIQTVDLIGEVLLADTLLNIVRTIRTQMLNDRCCFVKRLTFPSEITPWYARELQNSTGWTIIFKLKGIDILTQ